MKRIPSVLTTQQDVRDACERMYTTKSAAVRRRMREAIDDAASRATCECDGEAHSNPWIDNCHQCAPFWGRRMSS